MISQILAQAFNGFSFMDLPFLLIQLSTSGLLAYLVRIIWRRKGIESSEEDLLKYLIPMQIILTLIAIYSIKSPWMIVLFGFVAIFPLIGSSILTYRSRIFYMIVVGIAFGCGAGNFIVTCFVISFLILPLLYILK